MRCVHERAFWDRSSFATLTYDDEHLPADNGLDLAEFTKFWKRLRKQLGARKMRYYGCGEYGERFGRPHYHAIIFGVGARERALVDRAWGLGHVYLGSVTAASARYVADYVGKAVSPKVGPSLRGADALAVLTGAAYGSRRVPFAVMSQGLGRAYVDAHGSSFLSRPLTVDGKRVPVPRYYRDRLRKEVKLLDDLWVSEDFAPIVQSVEERELYDRSWFNREQVEANLRAKSGLAPKGFM